MGKLESFMDLSQGRGKKESTKPVLPEISAPSVQVTNRYAFQSYFDDTLLEKAVLVAAPNEPIIASTKKHETIPGYAIGLHPSSECPVAIEFEIGGQPSSSSAITLVPGQIIRPHGLPRGMESGNFSGFTYGLPMGWLGGGVVNLHVFPTSDADVSWPGRTEVIIQRQRMQILAPADVPAGVGSLAPFNWPTKFPFILGFNEQGIIQRNQPVLAMEPTRVEMSLRLATLAAAATMRIMIQASDAFDLARATAPYAKKPDNSQPAILTPVRFVDYTWGSYTPVAGIPAGSFDTAFPTDDAIPGPWQRLGCNNFDAGGIILVDATGTLAGSFVDVVRYARF